MEILVLVVVAAVMLVVAAMLLSVRPHLIPPGPSPLPVVGNLHLLYKKDLRALVQELQQLYGNIYSLYIGRRLVVVISGRWLLKEVFIRKAETFSNRPQDFGYFRPSMKRGILHNNGPFWHHQRRFVATVFRDLDTRANTMESSIAPEMIHLTSTLMEVNQRPFNPSRFLIAAASNVIFSLVLGIRFDTDDPQFGRFYQTLQSVMQHPNFHTLVQSQSWSNWIPGRVFKRNRKRSEEESELEDFICQHVKSRVDAWDDTEVSGSGVMCLADAYIRKIRQTALEGAGSSYNVENLIQIILELVYTGTDSIVVTLEWMILHLAMHPQCQERARDEIDMVLDGAFPSYADRERLPYLEAVILESQRLADVNSFSMLHVSTEDTLIDGLRIPSNTIMVPNMTSVLQDPKLFPSPEEFKPERYLDDRKASLTEAILNPFFTGKRSCLCETLARMEIFLFITAILQHFWIALPEDSPPPSLDGEFDVRRRPRPFHIKAIRRQV